MYGIQTSTDPLNALPESKNRRVKQLQALRYTNFAKLKNATSLDEAF
jgi:hypothetical protein